MTTKYETKEEALRMGLIYADRKDLEDGFTYEEILSNPEIVVSTKSIEQFGFVHENATTLTFNTKKGKVEICSTKFRNGFDLWLINSETGYSIRT